jgi:hypothetical protein
MEDFFEFFLISPLRARSESRAAHGVHTAVGSPPRRWPAARQGLRIRRAPAYN